MPTCTPKSDLLGVTMAVIHSSSKETQHGKLRTVPIAEAIGLTVVKIIRVL